MTLSDSLLRQFRKATGDLSSPPRMPPEEVEEYFDTVDEEYPDSSDRVRLAYAVLTRLNELLVASIPDVSYTANASSESLSDKRIGYERAIALWQGRLDTALGNDDDGLPVAWGHTHKTPLRDEEYPDDYLHL